MRRAANVPTAHRAGFTLIELVVVIGIILAVLAIVVAVLPSASSRAAQTGADRLQGWLLIAKQRALRDQAPRGLRLVTDGTQTVITELNYIEQPEPYSPPPGSTMMIFTPSATGNPQPGFWTVTVTPAIGPGLVSVNDFLEIVGDSNLRLIKGLTQVPNAVGPPSTRMIIGPQDPPPPLPPIPVYNPSEPSDWPLGLAPGESFTFTSGFRFVRQAQPLMGEPALLMPRDSGILYNFAQPQNPPPPPQPNSIFGFGQNGYPLALNKAPLGPPITDLMFAAGGGMVTPGINGNVVLWVYDTTQADPTEGGPTLITIYSRTGALAAHPVNLVNRPFQFYSFTNDGKNSGM